jgi:hypothetical protein
LHSAVVRVDGGRGGVEGLFDRKGAKDTKDAKKGKTEKQE